MSRTGRSLISAGVLALVLWLIWSRLNIVLGGRRVIIFYRCHMKLDT
jgi:hypothetical protein